ncbi:MAG: hypothetical protein E4H23_10525 [Chrysiogenales bacterium]|nr:MAG: hypothetical protein E4H23_10525 [Chrysiogenales bacterium]
MQGKFISFVLLFMAVTLVVSPDIAFRVTAVSVQVSEREFSGVCPHRFTFTGHIRANRRGTVRYRWLRSDGATSPEKILVFKAAGTRTVSTYWQLGGGTGSYPGRWQAIEILAPNSLTSNRAVFSLNCVPLMMAPTYEISGAIDSGPDGNLLAGRQVKVIVRRGGATFLSRSITLDTHGRGSYSFGRPLGGGRYQLVVEKLPYTGSSTLNVCFRGSEPADRWVELSTTNRHAIDQDFTILFVIGWDRGPCW